MGLRFPARLAEHTDAVGDGNRPLWPDRAGGLAVAGRPALRHRYVARPRGLRTARLDLESGALEVPPAVQRPSSPAAGLTYNSAFGLTGSAGLTISDFLGHHRIFLATDLFSASLDETNFLAQYAYLPRRTDYSVGVFHFKNFFFSRVTSFGEKLASTTQFTERNFGLIAGMSYPFSRFRRFDIDFQQVVVNRTFFEQVSPDFVVEGAQETKLVTAPTFSLTKDNVLYGFYGPVDGTRYFVSVTPTIPVTSNSLQYVTLFLDYRK